MTHDAQLAEARDRLATLAGDLSARFGPMPTASSFAGITATILTETIGRDGAAAFLHELAEELAEDQDPGWGGTA